MMLADIRGIIALCCRLADADEEKTTNAKQNVTIRRHTDAPSPVLNRNGSFSTKPVSQPEPATIEWQELKRYPKELRNA